MPTATLEEYLESIFRLSQEGPVKPTQLADAVGVSGPTVTATLRRLEAQDLVSRDGTDVMLTEGGRTLALDIVRRHRVAERFLVDALGLEWDVAHEDACLLEHALSPRVLEALERYLDNPEMCPHGHPIPNADGTIAETTGVSLAGLGAGCSATVLRVAEDDDAVLSYLGSLGMFPGTTVEIIEAAPFDGPLLVEVGGRRSALARDMAARIVVEPGEGCSV
jgi:DtxR family Mn-dependent transcriptional regulator